MFLPAGLHTATAERRSLDALARAGADLFEVGLAHSDAFLDGPVIQSAYHTALRRGHVLDRALRAVEHAAVLRPTILMTYWNPVARHDPERLAHRFADAGAAGIMVVDLPDHAAGTWQRTAAKAGLTVPHLAPRTATDQELGAIQQTASGWLYAPAATAPTGYRGPLDLAALAAAIQRVRATGPLPIVAGIGISTPALAAAVAPLVDAVVIGTPVVRALQQSPDSATVTVAAFADALRMPRH